MISVAPPRRTWRRQTQSTIAAHGSPVPSRLLPIPSSFKEEEPSRRHHPLLLPPPPAPIARRLRLRQIPYPSSALATDRALSRHASGQHIQPYVSGSWRLAAAATSRASVRPAAVSVVAAAHSQRRPFPCFGQGWRRRRRGRGRGRARRRQRSTTRGRPGSTSRAPSRCSSSAHASSSGRVELWIRRALPLTAAPHLSRGVSGL